MYHSLNLSLFADIVVPKAHTVPKEVEDALEGTTTINRWCTVNDVRFDPLLYVPFLLSSILILTSFATNRQNRVVSTGHDGSVCFWDFEGQETGHHQYPGNPAPVPHDLEYHHREPLLAVSCYNGYGIRLFSNLYISDNTLTAQANSSAPKFRANPFYDAQSQA